MFPAKQPFIVVSTCAVKVKEHEIMKDFVLELIGEYDHSFSTKLSSTRTALTSNRTEKLNVSQSTSTQYYSSCVNQ
jgi:hypothetical protein